MVTFINVLKSTVQILSTNLKSSNCLLPERKEVQKFTNLLLLTGKYKFQTILNKKREYQTDYIKIQRKINDKCKLDFIYRIWTLNIEFIFTSYINKRIFEPYWILYIQLMFIS